MPLLEIEICELHLLFNLRYLVFSAFFECGVILSYILAQDVINHHRFLIKYRIYKPNSPPVNLINSFKIK